MDYIKDKLEELRLEIEKKQLECKEELARCPEGSLVASNNRHKTYYYQATKENDHYIKKAITNKQQQIKALARKQYLIKEQKSLANNLNVIDRAIGKLLPDEPAAIIGQMSKTYQNLPTEMFFLPAEAAVTRGIDIEKIERMQSHARWAKLEYPKSDKWPERLEMVTSRGERMRSKSELLIAEMLYKYGIPFRYEEIIWLGSQSVAPDFGFRNEQYQPFWLEYCGKMDDPQYVESYIRKRKLYESHGITEWNNMIYIYETKNKINMRYIDTIIREQIVPRL